VGSAAAITFLLTTSSDTSGAPQASAGTPQTTSVPVPEPRPPVAGPPEPGSVGFLGDPGELLPVSRDTKPPRGTTWRDGSLVVKRKDFVLDGVYLRGGIDFYGTGTLTVRNSIIEFGYGSWVTIVGRTSGATLDVRDSTLRWRPDTEPALDSGAGIQVLEQVRVVALRNDISGTTDAIQAAADDSHVEGNWIHDLALVGRFPDNSHNDGIQVYGGRNLRISRNRIEIGSDGEHQNAAVFLQPAPGDAIPGPQILDNVLEGGFYSLRLEGATTEAVVVGNTFLRSAAEQADAYALDGATIAEWSDNARADGSAVPRP
jgi:hypothetical protein